MSFSKILIPIDFSERCFGAARFAIPLAERFDSEITFLYVQDPSRSGPSFVERDSKLLRDFLCAAFEHLDVKRVMRVGEPAAEIVAYARNDGSDLIMMPTHGYGTIRRRLVGSITAKVLRESDCPVWTGAHLVHGPTVEWIRPTTILSAVDADAGSEKALLWVSALASELNASLILIHVESRLDSPGEGYYSSEYRQHVLVESLREMGELQRAAGTHVPVILGDGDVPHLICEAAESLKADLVVIGRRATTLSGSLGSNTYAIVRESPCPVVSV